ncbi:MAG: DUF6786 family protein [Armatimonadota bacterium]
MQSILLSNLINADMETYLIHQPDGSELLVLPHGGRMLGLYAPGSETNFLWTNPVLDDVNNTRAFYASDDWHNSGGDRTWLAPEIELFYPNRPGDGDDYFQPRQLDPGNYKVVSTSEIITLVNWLSVKPFNAKQAINAEIRKSYMPAPNPLRYHDGMGDVAYAGYTQQTSLTLPNPDEVEDTMLALWNLLQMPNGGEMLIPTYSMGSPVIYFGNVPEGDLVVNDRLVRYGMYSEGVHKIGISADVCTGRAGYLYQKDGLWSLVIRNFRVNPSAEYIDIPWNKPAHADNVFQACNVNNEMGQFSELEYHAPSIGGSSGLFQYDDESQVWAFRGTHAEIVTIAQILLSPEII